MRKDTLLVIPACNEAENLPRVAAEIAEAGAGGVCDVVLVDDGSTDATARIGADAGFVVVRHPYNLGAGSAVHTGLVFAWERGYSTAVTLDADGQHRPADIKALLAEAARTGADVVIGSRFLSAGSYRVPIHRKIGMLMFCRLASCFIRRRITDASSGYRVYSRRAIGILARMDYPSDYQDADVLIYLSRGGMEIVETPVTMRKRLCGVSMIRNLRSAYYVYKNLLSIVLTLLRKSPGPVPDHRRVS
ncbi:MAG: glycosyltransferase family 2 protein [Deltaproteobacteria bacterium]|nr:glycosyltransferase family 2 protein [Deltaproteobacteria bacterium]